MNQVESSRKQVKDVVGAALDRVPVWTDTLAATSRVPAVRKKRVEGGFEQPELWPAASPRVSRSESTDVRSVAEPIAESVRFIEVKQLRPAAPAAVKPPVRRVAPAPASVIARGVPVQTIARFLNVNGAIEGMKPAGMRFDLPGRGLSQTLRLWRGTTETATYSTVGY